LQGEKHSCLEKGEFKGSATLSGYWLYELVALGQSYIVPAQGKQKPQPVSGEIYEISEKCLKEMDEEQNVAKGLFQRVSTVACQGNGDVLDVWVYEGYKIVPQLIESGDWRYRQVPYGKA
jgi:gamma-glutamylcyclotransferase (GGCT)/AIG2-like uncharacterized protein YtfP